MERWRRFGEKVKASWKEHGSRLILAITFLLVGALSFEAGLLQKSLVQPEPVVVRIGEAPAPSPQNPHQSPDQSSLTPPKETGTAETPTSTCVFVGSKKSNKYHHPTSRCAGQIKPENKRCFTSAEDAAARGYLPGCLEP